MLPSGDMGGTSLTGAIFLEFTLEFTPLTAREETMMREMLCK